MKLTLNKKKLKNLSKDNKVLPQDMTPQVAGGYTTYPTSYNCWDEPTEGCPAVEGK